MLIDFNFLMSKYGVPKGIIHIGAHLLQERESYHKFNLTNTIWIEANPKIAERAKSKISTQSSEKVYNYAITDFDGTIDLNVTNSTQSSSILKLGTHKKHYPEIQVSSIINVECRRMDTFIKENNINIQNYNFVNLDIQGAELKALKGFGDYIKKYIDFLYIEVNSEELYEGGCLLPELNNFLDSCGFKQVETRMTNKTWGEAFFIKK